MARRSKLLELASAIDGPRAAEQTARFSAQFSQAGQAQALAVAVLLATAYPALAQGISADRAAVEGIAREGHRVARSREDLFGIARRLTGIGFDAAGPLDADLARAQLRRFAQRERARIALREALPPALGGADVDVTSGELAALADVTIQIALEEALIAADERFGPPLTPSGRGRFSVFGMGKLGGEELNAGSDVDLIYFYDTDDGAAGDASLHDYWTRVAKRLTATLEEVTEDGFVWRVDLRLRPEGRTGPIVNSLAAAERYYESFGRLWERAALLRARPVAGDPSFGEEATNMLAPFVWRRRVDPRVAVEMVQLAERSRVELSEDATRDLKLGPGGIREAEFFVQTLALVWGGVEPRVRARGTLDGLRRLRAMGLVSDREWREISHAYVALRRAEHVVQNASGVQTHLLPKDPADLRRVARVLGFPDEEALLVDLERHTKAVAARLLSLVPKGNPVKSRWSDALASLERGKPEAFAEAIARRAAITGPDGEERSGDLARDLFELARQPDSPLGTRTREQFPELAETVLDAILDAADPEQAARYLRMFFSRVKQSGIYVRLLGDDPRAVRKLVEALGASAFLGDAVVNHPELGDAVLFSSASRKTTPEAVKREVELAVEIEMTAGEGRDDDPEETFVAALRSAKSRVTIDIALADLAGEIGTREVTLALSSLADTSLAAAARFALRTDRVRGLSIVAMGKLGGREIGYGSDLDVLFLFDPAAAPEGKDPDTFFARAARTIIRLVSMPHAAGPGYELDTRLRPSGNQGLLVTSLESFRRYHGLEDGPANPESVVAGPTARSVRAAAWERLALLRARHAAGDAVLGAEAMALAERAAYESSAAIDEVAAEIRRLRTRLAVENAQERPGRYDIKLGRGGLVDVEFALQWLQMKHGAEDKSVRTTETSEAIEALARAGYLSPAHAEALREGYAFLRKLEQRIRIVHATPVNLLEEHALGLPTLARRVGIRDRRGKEASGELLARYREVTDRVRAAYEAILGEGGATTDAS